MIPNSFAYLALIAWPLLILAAGAFVRPLFLVTLGIVGGYLLLPMKVVFDFPLVPPLDKAILPSVFCFLALGVFHRRALLAGAFERPEKALCLILVVVLPLFSVLFNLFPTFHTSPAPAVELKFYFTLFFKYGFMIAPFLLAVVVVRTGRDYRNFLWLMLIVGLGYSLFVLYEVIMSPQLHTKIYGFFPHSWAQQIRYGGFRPVVFLGHGLQVAMFVVVVLGVALSLAKNFEDRQRKLLFFVIPYVIVLLLLCRSVGPALLGLGLLVLWVAPDKLKGWFSRLVVMAVFLYPILLSLGLLPQDLLVEWIASFDADRAQSVWYRFKNEQDFIRVMDGNFLFGWSHPDRFLIDGFTLDGFWIIHFGSLGLLGFLSVFGLLSITIFRTLQNAHLFSLAERRVVIFHAVVLSVVMLNLLPNSAMHSWTWFFAGALLGRVNYQRTVISRQNSN